MKRKVLVYQHQLSLAFFECNFQDFDLTDQLFDLLLKLGELIFEPFALTARDFGDFIYLRLAFIYCADRSLDDFVQFGDFYYPAHLCPPYHLFDTKICVDIYLFYMKLHNSFVFFFCSCFFTGTPVVPSDPVPLFAD
jgi:hypothetical protein